MPVFVNVVNTSSPGVPSGTGLPSASTASTKKWSSATFNMPSESSDSAATPGPMISDRP